MNTRLVLAALLVTAAAALTGCGSGELPAPNTMAAVNPEPAGAGEITEPPPIESSCDTEASLRPGPLPRPGAMPQGSAMAAIVANGKLKVGVDQNTYLFGFRNPGTGELEGFDIDIAHEIANALFGDPNKIELRSVTAAERLPALRDKKVDMIVRTFSATCERRKEVDFSSVYYGAAQRILAQRDSGINSGADLTGKRVCVARGTTASTPLFAMANRPTVIGVTNWTDCLVALQQRLVDAISGDAPILFGLVEQDRNLQVVGDPIGVGGYAVGLPKGSDDLVRFVNGVLERMRSDGTWERIYATRLSALGPSPGQPAPRYVG
ncbi:glutamate ABC transporter substrate-binding protein [Nocardia sp. NPDC051321]|uniref:glutamate ABC transporter substrate-binding protein n=1 Tax=Nocardia sp. NPDC051321 TaxID=3364323 RepID=UPI00379EA30A